MDFIFYPDNPPAADGIILELKVDHSPEEAIEQIKEKNYMLRFTGNTSEHQKVKIRRVLLVGIGYDKETKKHRCKIEEIKLQ